MKSQVTHKPFYKKAEKLIVYFGCLGIILGVFLFSLNLFLSDEQTKWWFWIVAILFIIGAISGVVSVVASNEKSPIKLLILSIIATIFKLLYPIIQVVTGNDDEAINSTVFFGQSISMIFLFLQVFLWLRWNKQADSGKFLTRHFKDHQRYIFAAFVLLLFMAGMVFSKIVMNNNWLWAFIDVFGGIAFMLGNWLMIFGNIYCFFFFFASDLTWIGWTIVDLLDSDNSIMQLIALATLVEVLSYTGLAITGYFAWAEDKKALILKS